MVKNSLKTLPCFPIRHWHGWQYEIDTCANRHVESCTIFQRVFDSFATCASCENVRLTRFHIDPSAQYQLSCDWCPYCHEVHRSNNLSYMCTNWPLRCFTNFHPTRVHNNMWLYCWNFHLTRVHLDMRPTIQTKILNVWILTGGTTHEVPSYRVHIETFDLVHILILNVFPMTCGTRYKFPSYTCGYWKAEHRRKFHFTRVPIDKCQTVQNVIWHVSIETRVDSDRFSLL